MPVWVFLGGLLVTGATLAAQDKQNKSSKEMNDILMELENAKLAQTEELTKESLALQEKGLGLKEEVFAEQKKMNIMEMVEGRKDKAYLKKADKLKRAQGYLDQNSALKDKMMSWWGNMIPGRRAA